jgi:hypothetical protein
MIEMLLFISAAKMDGGCERFVISVVWVAFHILIA